MTGPRGIETTIDRLEDELERDDLTEEDRKGIRDELRDIERELAEEERWREEGHARGWL